MKLPIAWTVLLGVAFVGLTVLWADEPAKTDTQPLVVTDSGGKEHKLKIWKFTAGTRRLNWLAPKDKPAEGPEALEVRELDSTTLAEGVLTLVPLDRLRTVEYDAKKETVKLTAATGPKDDAKATLTGSTGYKNTNRPTLEGEVDQGAEKLMFLCGVEKGIKAATFPATKVEALPEGRPAILTTRRGDDSPTEHKMGDFQPLYRFADGHEMLSPTLYCKTGKFEIAKIAKATRSAGAEGNTVWILSFPKGDDQTLTLDPSPKIDGKEATLAGFIGRVPAGYKLFPAALIQEVEFDVK
jgi:hypothetical protein